MSRRFPEMANKKERMHSILTGWICICGILASTSGRGTRTRRLSVDSLLSLRETASKLLSLIVDLGSAVEFPAAVINDLSDARFPFSISLFTAS